MTRRSSWMVARVVSGTLLAAVVPPAVQAQAPATTPAAEEPLDVVIVTGTRRLDRTVAESTVPIDVVDAESLKNQGYTEANKILNSLVPSFNFPQPSITDGTDVVRPATLRGLGPDQTLVLVNGKRRHPTALLNLNGSVGRGSAAVDLNLIPAAAIERIEVLRDGAAAQYGSDAIAGVINIVLKSAATGGGVSTSFGQYMTTLNGTPDVAGIQTTTGGAPVVLADGTYATVTSGERSVDDGETWSLSGNWGLPLGSAGFINLTAEYRDRSDTNRSGADTRQQFAQSIATPTNPAAGELGFDRINHRYGDAETADWTAFINAGYDISDSTQFYAFSSYGSRDGESAGFFRRSGDARNRNFSASTTTFVPYYVNGFLPLIVTELEDFSLAAGFKGDAGPWNWDVSVVHGSNKFDFGVENSFNTSFGSASQQTFDSGGLEFNQQTLNIDFQRLLDVSFVQSLSFAVGAEYRQENFKIRPGDVQSYAGGPFIANGAPAGAQVFPGFRTRVNEDRDSQSLYVDFDADVTGRWNVDLATRFENYSDFGSDLNGKLAMRFAVTDAVSLRGGVSTGFRAPSLHQMSYETASTNNVGGVLLEIGTFPVDSPVARALGSKDLEPESSINYSAGIVLNPVPRLNITLDFYRIEIDDRIVVSDNLQGAQVAALLAAAGFGNVTSARFFVNGLNTTTDGFDLIGTYRWDLPLGSVNLTAGYNYNTTDIDEVLAAPGPLAAIPNLVLFGRQEQLRFEEGQPKDKIVLSGDWSYDRFGTTLRATRYGDVLSPGAGTTAQDDLQMGAKWLLDLEFRFDATERWQLALGANNVLDEYPDENPVGARAAPFTGNNSTNNYFLPYSTFSPFGFNGRYVYGRVNFSW
jgi:iron complex outermembrane recepter protein